MSEKGWIDKYRPTTLTEVVGNIYMKRELSKRLKEGSLRQNILLSGNSGTGKTTLAKILTKTLACTNPQEDKFEKTKFKSPCNECTSCKNVEFEDSDSALKFYDGAQLSKDGLNLLREECEHESFLSPIKVIFIDEIQNIGSGRDSTMQTLLKIIEKDYEGKVYFIMSTMDIKKINKAVVDRFHIHFRLKDALSQDLIEHGGKILGKESYLEGVDLSNLKDEGIDLFFKEGLFMLSSSSNGSVRKFVNDLETCMFRGLYSEAEIIEELNIISNKTTFEMMKKLIEKDTSFFDDLKKVESSLQEFFALSHSILVDLNIYLETKKTRFDWQEASFKRLDNKEDARKALSTYNAIYEGQASYFNEQYYRGKVLDYFNNDHDILTTQLQTAITKVQLDLDKFKATNFDDIYPSLKGTNISPPNPINTEKVAINETVEQEKPKKRKRSRG